MTPDLDAPPARRTWFGFSPAVVAGLVAVALVLAGAAAFAKHKSAEAYVAELTAFCVRSDQAISARLAETQAASPGKLTSITADVSEAAQIRLEGLRRIEPGGGHAEDHAELLAMEHGVIAKASELSVDSVDNRASPQVSRTILSTVDEVQAKYVALGVPKICTMR